MQPILNQFNDFYQQLDANNLGGLTGLYSADVTFCDPVHCLHGLTDLQQYFEQLMQNLDDCRFDIEHTLEQDGEAYVRWIMVFHHPRINKGEAVSVPGISHLKFDQQIYYHRDYFDLGAMLYEHLPLLGTVIRKIKSKLAQ